jgi:DNA primase large subunit
MPTPKVTPLIENEVTLARYPFLPQATEWIQGLAIEHDIDLDELLDGEWMEKARSRARIRLIDSIESKDGVAVVGGDIFTEEGRIIEAFSFYYARLVVFASEDERLIARWAQAEATRAEQVLTKDSENLEIIAKTFLSDIEKDVDLSQSKQLVNTNNNRRLRQNQDGNLWKIGMSDFIEICPKITGSRWRLANAQISKGKITLFNEQQYSSSAKLARLLRERIKHHIEQEALQKMQNIDMELALRLAEPVGMVRNLMASKASEAINLVGAEESDWPPCMRKIIADLANGVNVNHFGRLFLASISAKLALPEESCIGFFRGAPDFSESTTTYQVNHVYNGEYTPASCGKLKVNHNCPVLPGDDRLCDISWMDHPLKYIRATQRWKAKNQQAQASMRKDDEPLDVENSEGNDSDESVKNLTSE